MKLPNRTKLLISLALPQLAGLLGSVFTMSAVTTWYATLQKPPLSPPNWIFGPVWTTLYLLMGVSLYLVWRKWSVLPWTPARKKMALVFFGVQLALNTLWSVLFFGLQSPGLALINIILMVVAIKITMLLFWRVSRVATWLLLPYLLWVSFATYLNAAIWYLN